MLLKDRKSDGQSEFHFEKDFRIRSKNPVRIKVSNSLKGWSEALEVEIENLCKKYDIPFLDRAGVVTKLSNFIAYTEGPLPESYIYFEHRSFPDLPHDVVIQVETC